MSFGVHKDHAPAATIRRIKGILAELDIAPREEVYRFAKNCFSARLWDPSLSVGTNGKGVTKELARASAYGEFMERLQNGLLYGTQYGLMREEIDLFPDARWLGPEQIAAVMRALGRRARRASKRGGQDHAMPDAKKVLCVPYWRASDGAVVHLPRYWINFGLSSNGMCAGNTAEEALVQGLCEIFERHALRQLFWGKANAPTIPLESLRNLKVCELISQIEAQGGRVMVKDCTLGGTVPVVGVVYLDADCRKYKIALGSDPVLDVAIHRCLTEAVQGCEQHDIGDQMADLDQVLPGGAARARDRNLELQLLKAMTDGSGTWSEAFFHSNGKPQHQRIFARHYSGHGDMLTSLLRLTRSLAPDIYIRDVSYLGFPAFQVYVPGLSEGKSQDLEQYSAVRARFSHLLLRIPKLSPSALRRSIGWMDELTQDMVWATYERITGVHFRESASLHGTDLAHLSAFLRLRIGDYAGAYRSLHRYLRSQEVETFGRYEMCALFALKSRSAGMRNQEIVRSLSGLFGSSLVREVVRDVGQPSRGFRYLRLPVCGRCQSCPARSDCLYPRWKKVFTTLRKKFAQNPIDQAQLTQRLGAYLDGTSGPSGGP